MRPSWHQKLPFYYGWVIIAVAFVTMAVSVSARTAYSLLLPPLTEEFGWNLGLAAGAFSFGFIVSALISPYVGALMDKRGPRVVIGIGIVMVTAGYLWAPYIETPWQLYLTLGILVGTGANLMSFTAQSLYLPFWFVKRRAFAISLAFSGVGIGAIILLPWFQTIILSDGWRAACITFAILTLVVLLPLNLLVRRRPEDIGLNPDGAESEPGNPTPKVSYKILDPEWVATEWTLKTALRTSKFWWIFTGYFAVLFAWYAVQVHQTRYLIDVGFSPTLAAWALGLVSIVAVPGQIGLGALSDKIGREWVWTVACGGFAMSYAALIALEFFPSDLLLYVMVFTQGFLGYALTSVMGPIVAEIFEGPHYGAIFGGITVALFGGGAAGPWAAGFMHDVTGSYAAPFYLAIGLSIYSAIAIWQAGPGRIRSVKG